LANPPTREWRANAPSTRKTQYFEIFGNRAIYHHGWMANTVPAVIPCITAPRTGYRDGQG
jgi:hypothetical protein